MKLCCSRSASRNAASSTALGPFVEGQVGHRVGGLGDDVEGGGEVRLLHPELAERLGPERLGFGVLGDGEVLGADRRRLRTRGEAVRRDRARIGRDR